MRVLLALLYGTYIWDFFIFFSPSHPLVRLVARLLVVGSIARLLRSLFVFSLHPTFPQF